VNRSGVDASEALAGKLRTLIQLIELISSSLDTDEILRQIAAAAVRLTDARCASLWVADEATRTVELRACSDAAIGAGHPNPHLAYGQGVAGWVILHDEPIKASDLGLTPMVAPDWYGAHGLRSMYALPIAYQDSVVGVLVLLAEQPFDLESEEYEILEALIAEAGAAIRNSRLLAESERRRRTAEALAELSRLSSETLDLGTVARRVVDSVRTLLGAREAALYRLVPETGDLAALALMGERRQALGPGAVFPRGTGVIGLAVRERRPVATPNFADDPRIRHDPAILERLGGASYRAVLALPLLLKDRVIGALAVCDTEGRAFLESEIRLAQAFADHAALVLESVQLFDDAARRRREVDVLAEVVGQINSSLDLGAILGRIAAGACELTGADGAQIALREPGTDGVRVIHRRGGQGAADDALIGLVIEPGKGSGGLVLTTLQPFRTTNYAEDPRITREYTDRVRAAGVVAQIVIPIQDGELKGLLYVFNRSARAFTDRDEAALGRLANHAAVAIGNAHLLGETESRRREAEVLAEVGRLVSQSLEPDEVGQRIVESVGPLLGSAMASLYRISLETGDYVLLASTGVGDWNRTLPRGTAAVGLAVRRDPARPDVRGPGRDRARQRALALRDDAPEVGGRGPGRRGPARHRVARRRGGRRADRRQPARPSRGPLLRACSRRAGDGRAHRPAHRGRRLRPGHRAPRGHRGHGPRREHTAPGRVDERARRSADRADARAPSSDPVAAAPVGARAADDRRRSGRRRHRGRRPRRPCLRRR
jgi:GAF domain-containing protein